MESSMEKFKKISFLLATLFVATALAIKFAKPEWQKYATYSVVAGVVFFAISLWFERGELKKFFTARSTKHGANAVIMVIFVLAILGLLNWIVNRHPMKYDTTKNKQFSLSSLTVSQLKDLKKPVKITAFFSESQEENNRQQMKDLLDNYKTYSRQVQTQMIDPRKSPRWPSRVESHARDHDRSIRRSENNHFYHKRRGSYQRNPAGDQQQEDHPLFPARSQ